MGPGIGLARAEGVYRLNAAPPMCRAVLLLPTAKDLTRTRRFPFSQPNESQIDQRCGLQVERSGEVITFPRVGCRRAAFEKRRVGAIAIGPLR